jgi:hypothetical protein
VVLGLIGILVAIHLKYFVTAPKPQCSKGEQQEEKATTRYEATSSAQ